MHEAVYGRSQFGFVSPSVSQLATPFEERSTMFKIDWDKVMQLSKALAEKVPGWRIWGIPRGGSIVEAIMANHGCQLTDGVTSDVVVDDIADSGKTLARCIRPTAALIVRQGCEPLPTYWIMMLATSDYILFPWEDEVVAQEKIDAGISFRDKDSE